MLLKVVSCFDMLTWWYTFTGDTVPVVYGDGCTNTALAIKLCSDSTGIKYALLSEPEPFRNIHRHFYCRVWFLWVYHTRFWMIICTIRVI